MKPLIVLVAVFVIALFTGKIFQGSYHYPLAGRIAMSAMLVFTGIAHFAFTKGMAMMLPPFIPNKTAVVYLTGLIEFAAALGLLIPSMRGITGWLLLAFFACVFPSNIYAAVHHINYQTGAMDGKGVMYLWFRIPLQVLFMVWVYLAAIRG